MDESLDLESAFWEEHCDDSKRSADRIDAVFGKARQKIIRPPKPCKRKRRDDETNPEDTDEVGNNVDQSVEQDTMNEDDDTETRSTKRRKQVDEEEISFLQRRIRDSMKGVRADKDRRPSQIIERKIHENSDNEPYKKALEQLAKEKPTDEQMDKLEKAKMYQPKYIGRTASLTPGMNFDKMKSGTNGFTTQLVMMPAAETHADEAVHANLHDMSQGRLVYMIGNHLIWKDMRSDEFLSYSIDPLFLVVHALLRYHEGQKGVRIMIVDCDKAKTVDRQPAIFYSALDLYEIFNVPGWTGWSQLCRDKLRPRKFTQELLGHGTILLEDNRFQEVLIEKLIEDGLFELFPGFHVPETHLREGLYTTQVVCRTIGYPPDDYAKRQRRIYSYDHCSNHVAFTVDVLEMVQKMTRNFMVIPEGTDPETYEPHLYVFLCFLTFQKRMKRDPVLLKWIKDHYKAEDVIDLYDDGAGFVRPGFTHVASNLPGVMQRLDLIRDAAFAFGLPELPSNVVEERNSFIDEEYAAEDGRLQKHNRSCSKGEYDPDKHQDNKDKAKRRRLEKAEEKRNTKGMDTNGIVAQAPEIEVFQEMNGKQGEDADEEAASSNGRISEVKDGKTNSFMDFLPKIVPR